MDLKGNAITVGELLKNPKVNAVLGRRFGKLMRHPVVGASHSLTLAQVLEMAGVYFPRETIRQTLEELKQV